jgi:hypothetical protein
VLALLGLTMVACISSLAQTNGNALSKEKLVALKKAGVSDSVLIQQIQKDGIAFDMNADTTLELKNAGFSNDVLRALLQDSTKTPPASAQPARNDSVAALYKAGRFPELSDHLKATLKDNPTDYRTHALLIMTLLKMKEKDAAQSEFQALSAHGQDPAAAPYVKQVKALLDTLAKTQEAKDKLLAALKEYRTTDAMAVVDELPASPTQREVLKLNLDVYQAKFDQARDRFSKIQFASFAEKERSTKIQDSIATSESQYQKLMSRVDLYLYSKWILDVCFFPLSQYQQMHPSAFPSMSLSEYYGLIQNLSRLAPLTDEAANLSFHAELLAGKYDDLETLGDHLLKVRGNIRIPFYASDRFFRLVIDSSKGRIYTETDSHPVDPGVRKFTDKTWAPLIPFDLSFNQITGISQRVGTANASMPTLAFKSYALKVEPDGVAPNYSLMNILFCSAGEKAVLTVTRNMGQYVLHVIGGTNTIKAELVDPSKAKGPSSGWLTGLLMMGASMSSNAALSSMAIQGLQADQAQQMATYQAQQAAWDSFSSARDSFNFVEADAFSGLEQLLGVLN